jgi:4-aminobutyrate aminotransferase-like enzyme
LKKHLEAARILVGGSSDPEVVRLMPPLNISDAGIAALADAVRAFK